MILDVITCLGAMTSRIPMSHDKIYSALKLYTGAGQVKGASIGFKGDLAG
jgi:hypothetical protein